MFRRKATKFLNLCYLAGPGTHGGIVELITVELSNMAFGFFFSGVMVGAVVMAVLLEVLK